jgi:hypothetical protein
LGNVNARSFKVYQGLVDISGTLQVVEKADFLAIDAAKGCQSIANMVAPRLIVTNDDNMVLLSTSRQQKYSTLKTAIMVVVF